LAWLGLAWLGLAWLGLAWCIHRLFREQEVELVVVCIVTKCKQILSQSAVTTSHNA